MGTLYHHHNHSIGFKVKVHYTHILLQSMGLCFRGGVLQAHQADTWSSWGSEQHLWGQNSDHLAAVQKRGVTLIDPRGQGWTSHWFPVGKSVQQGEFLEFSQGSRRNSLEKIILVNSNGIRCFSHHAALLWEKQAPLSTTFSQADRAFTHFCP